MYRVRARLVKIFLWSDIFMVGLIRQTNHAEPYAAMKGVLISLTKTMPLDYAVGGIRDWSLISKTGLSKDFLMS